MRSILLLLISVQPLIAGISRYSQLVVADSPGEKPNPRLIRVTYLGTNGYQLETAGHSILIDPYFSRISFARATFNWPVCPDTGRIEEGSSHLTRKADAIVVTHAHFDHLLDAPILMKRTGARLIGSSSAIELATRAGAVRSKCDVVSLGTVRSIGPWRINVLPASHDRLFMMGVPFNGPVKETGPPVRAGDWVCGEPLSYLIVANGFRIFIDSGGTPAVLPSKNIGPVDLAILGMALPDSRARFVETMQRLRPRYVLPSHQDNFFLPLDRGFQFATLSDFPFVRRKLEINHLPGKLILLDYFRPWTLPRR